MTRENTVNVPREPTPEMLEPFARVLCSALNLDPDEPEAPHGEWPTWYGQCGPLAVAYREALSAAPLHEGEGEDWSELERLARAAEKRAPGQWERDTEKGEGEYGIGDDTHSGFMVPYVMDSRGKRLFDAHASEIALIEEDHSFDENGADYSSWDQASCEVLDFIAAANPATILKLIASARSAHEREGEPVVWRDVLAKAYEDHQRGAASPNDGLIDFMAKRVSALAAPPPSVEVERLREALEKIERWFGEFPSTGRFWPDGEPMSYASEYGSNGERDFMRGVARAALSRKQEPGVPTPGGEGE